MLPVYTLTHSNKTETFVWRWTDESKEALLRYLGLFASSNLTSFSWEDAAFASEFIRNTSQSGESMGVRNPITR